MKNFFAALAICVALVTTSMDADAARRFGGGSSFGRSAPTLTQKAAPSATPKLSQQQGAKTQQAAKPATNAAAAKPASPWRGMLMGAAAALGIAGLMSALGLSEGFTQALMMVLMAVAAFFVLRMVLGLFLARKMHPAGVGAHADAGTRHNGMNEFRRQEPEPQAAARQTTSDSPATVGSVMDMFSNGKDQPVQDALSIPQGFDTQGFESVARENFVKLQRAWDTGNVVEISDFTTNDLFITVTHQLRERGAVAQKSEIINLDAKFLGLVQDGDEYVAVVEFNGAMKISGEFEQVAERWVLVRPVNESAGWLLAGIEQIEA